MIVLGIHGGVTLGQHESAAALVVDGRVRALCEEERYARIKSAYGMLPLAAIRACLTQANLRIENVDLVVSPGATYADHAARIESLMRHNFGHSPRVELVHHQQAHLATAFYASGLEEALCLSIDASGDGDCCHVGFAKRGEGIKLLEAVPNDNSLGFFYTLMTHFLGFTDGDEYKVMGLAPYGEDTVDMSAVVRPTATGWRFDRRHVRSRPPLRSPFEPMYAPALTDILGPARVPGQEYGQHYRNVARSTQAAFERCLMAKAKYVSSLSPGTRALCFAGGAALNCSANRVLRNSGLFEEVYVPPVSSDRGLALGCAYLGAASFGDRPWQLWNAFLGDAYGDAAIRAELDANGSRYVEVGHPAEAAAELLAQGKIIGWHQGRSEAGARSLGGRSILASCSEPGMKDRVNARIKYREEFRPFAPAALASHAGELFDTGGGDFPYMCFTVDALPGAAARVPAVVHVDGTARLQTVRSSDNELFHEVIRLYRCRTGIPAVLNTSFNLKGQPIVETPRDALMTFHGCGLDALVVGSFVVSK